MRLTSVLLALFLTSQFVSSKADAQNPILIGDINSYTKIRAFTEPYRMGLDLAIAHANANGGAKGRNIKIIYRDDKGDPAVAVRLAEELVKREKVTMLTGAFYSHVGLAISDYAKQSKIVYLAAEPLADSLVWKSGHRYVFRLRPSTYMQASMLAEEAAKSGITDWASIAPNYTYGQEAVASFQNILTGLNPKVNFGTAQWPALGKIDAAAETYALIAGNPQGIFNVTFGGDLAKFVREGQTRGLFDGRKVYSLLSGEPEYLDALGDSAPVGWVVTGYPWQEITSPAHRAFVADYRSRYGVTPKLGSLVGYNTGLSVMAALKEAQDLTSEGIINALEDLPIATPIGKIQYRKIDHQSTMGAFVGRIALKDGKGVMVDWVYKHGADYLPDDATTAILRQN